MSVREYARSRKARQLPGGSHPAVLNAIKTGRLRESVRDGKIVDPALADQEWTRNTDHSEAPVSIRERAARQESRAAPALTVVDVIGPEDPPADVDAAPVLPDAPPSGDGLNVKEAAAARLYWQAKNEELKFKTAAKELVPAKDVASRIEARFHACKTKLLGIPSRARQLLPHLSVEDIGVLESLNREALEELANGEVLP